MEKSLILICIILVYCHRDQNVFFQIFISFLYFLSRKILCLFTHVSNGVVAVFKLMGMSFKH